MIPQLPHKDTGAASRRRCTVLASRRAVLLPQHGAVTVCPVRRHVRHAAARGSLRHRHQRRLAHLPLPASMVRFSRFTPYALTPPHLPRRQIFFTDPPPSKHPRRCVVTCGRRCYSCSTALGKLTAASAVAMAFICEVFLLSEIWSVCVWCSSFPQKLEQRNLKLVSQRASLSTSLSCQQKSNTWAAWC